MNNVDSLIYVIALWFVIVQSISHDFRVATTVLDRNHMVAAVMLQAILYINIQISR